MNEQLEVVSSVQQRRQAEINAAVMLAPPLSPCGLPHSTGMRARMDALLQGSTRLRPAVQGGPVGFG